MNQIRYPANESPSINGGQNKPVQTRIPDLKHLQASLSELKERFFVVEEFPYLNRERFPEGIIEEARDIPASHLPSYAASLKSRQLEGLILDLTGDIRQADAERIAEILSFRLSPRILKLFNQVFQYHYDKPGVSVTATVLGQAAEKENVKPDCCDLIRLYALSEDQDAVRIAKEAIVACDDNILAFNNKYTVSPKSPLAVKAYIDFFNDSEKKEIFKDNRIYFVQLIRNQDLDLLIPLIRNYLSLFDIETYEHAINIAILKYMGQPYTGVQWDKLNKKLRKKFALWCFWYELHKHFITSPKKMETFSPYIELIRSTEILSDLDNALVIDFGDLVVVDMAGDPYSFFYRDKELYLKQIKAFREEGTPPFFMQKNKTPYTARDFIIESEENPCMILNYESVNIFYIREMLDILMDLEPDLRKKSLAKR